MKIRTYVAGAAVAGAAIVAGTTGVALAQEDSPPATDGPRAEFVCANLDQIQQLQADRATLITARLALLDEARVAAEEGGNTKAVERIDRRIERASERQAKVAERQQRLTDFAAENC